MSDQEWQDWNYLCQWLALRPSNSGAYRLRSKEYLTKLPAKHRKELALIFYSAGWGWRLRKGWQERLEALRPDGVQSEPLRDCTACEGTGQRTEPPQSLYPGAQYACPICDGTGKEL
jgi:hypothetical protein